MSEIRPNSKAPPTCSSLQTIAYNTGWQSGEGVGFPFMLSLSKHRGEPSLPSSEAKGTTTHVVLSQSEASHMPKYTTATPSAYCPCDSQPVTSAYRASRRSCERALRAKQSGGAVTIGPTERCVRGSVTGASSVIALR